MTSPDDAFQTLTTLRGLLDQAGAAPRRRFGQNFLIDRNLMNKLVAAADLARGDVVLEIGAGTGSLTGLIAPFVSGVVAVEIDDRMAAIAGERLRNHQHVTLLRTDALARKSEISPGVVAAVQEARRGTTGELKLVANLPYDVATSIVMNLLIGDLDFAKLCFTVQREVADRFLANPGSADYGPVSILTRLLTKAHRIARAPASAFWPPPRVESAMLSLTVIRPSPLSADERTEFAALVRTIFQKRRKTIGAIIKRRPDADRLLTACVRSGVDPSTRPEELNPTQWLQLYRAAK